MNRPYAKEIHHVITHSQAVYDKVKLPESLILGLVNNLQRVVRGYSEEELSWID